MENKTLILIAILFAMIGMVGAGIQYLEGVTCKNCTLENPTINSSIYNLSTTNNLCGIRSYNTWYYADTNIYLENAISYSNNDLINSQYFSLQIDINVNSSGIGVIQLFNSGYVLVLPDNSNSIAASVIIPKNTYYYLGNTVTSPDLVLLCDNWREFRLFE